jgi:serine/threonine protein kinase/tetratricopeptide (TPR) repeat protein
MEELNEPTQEPTAETAEAPASDAGMRGVRIGPYKILREIGEGGFGAVYLAEQEQPVKRTVAIKVIKAGMDTRQVVARFEAERQALALMDHPHIARVIDAGATENGRPYFVMDFVKGEPITTYCDRHTMGLNARLALFVQVCDAVQHAHSKGVIHRDLKPRNILVASQDGVASAKVIDFGIAKATAGKLTDRTLVTEQFAMIGTPEYMSPEQAEGSADIDTRADVYSLGVILYELLTGTTPFDSKALRQGGLADIQRQIREITPPKPSTRISQAGDSAGAIARSRQTDPKRLTLHVRGELDWIVLKAVEKDRARRYETANGLAMDVRRYLAGEPVAAAPPSATYQLQKMVRRYRAGLAAAAVIVLLLVAFAGTTMMQNVRVRRERDHAERERQKAEQITRLLVSLFKVNDPAEGKGGTVTAREILDRGAKQIPRSLVDQPDVTASLLGTIGEIYTVLGLFEPAQPLLEESLRLSRTLPQSAPALAVSLARLAELQRDRGRAAEAEQLAREALALRQQVHGPEHPEVAEAMGLLASALQGRQRFDEAEQMYRGAAALDAKLGISNQPSAVTRLAGLAVLLERTGRRDEAEKLHRQALAHARTAYGTEHPALATIVFNLGNLMRQTDRSAEAEPFLREALAIDRKLFGNEHPSVGSDLNVLGLVLLSRGQLGEAESMLREALAIKRKVLGSEHPNVPPALNNLALVLSSAGRHDEAVALAREAVALDRKVLGSEHRDLATHMSNLATLLNDAGRSAEAEPVGREALAMRQKVLQAGHPELAQGLVRLGEILLARGNVPEAISALEQARAFPIEKVPAKSSTRALAASLLGACLTLRGDYAGAETLLLEAHAYYAERAPEGGSARRVRQRLVDLYTAWGAPEKAKAFVALRR